MNISNVNVSAPAAFEPVEGFNAVTQIDFDHDVVFPDPDVNFTAADVAEAEFRDNFPFGELNELVEMFGLDLSDRDNISVDWIGLNTLIVSYNEPVSTSPYVNWLRS